MFDITGGWASEGLYIMILGVSPMWLSAWCALNMMSAVAAWGICDSAEIQHQLNRILDRYRIRLFNTSDWLMLPSPRPYFLHILQTNLLSRLVVYGPCTANCLRDVEVQSFPGAVHSKITCGRYIVPRDTPGVPTETISPRYRASGIRPIVSTN